MMATSASTDKFRIAAQGYLNDGRFSDFTIVCGDKEFKVHRCFISAHSKYFEKACDGMFQVSVVSESDLQNVTNRPSGKHHTLDHFAGGFSRCC